MRSLLLAFMLSLLSPGPKIEGALNYYEYGSSTMRAYPYEYYCLERSDEQGMTLTWSKNSSDYTVLRVPDNAALEVAALIKEYKLYKLKETYRPPFDVKDGMMWHVYFRFDKGRVSCSADNAWPPDRLREGIDAVNEYFNKLIDASTEADVIEIRKDRK